jgi:hypothetical protein
LCFKIEEVNRERGHMSYLSNCVTVCQEHKPFQVTA